MSEFTTLRCPMCGGKLEISSRTSITTCLYCGTEHLLRWDSEGVSLEHFARCPICRRNDKSIKMTGITNNQRLQKPLEPENVQDSRSYRTGCSLLFIVAGILVTFSMMNGEILPKLLAAIFFFGLAIMFFWMEYKDNKDAKLDYSHKWNIWKKANEKWKKLYYCERDDIVFNPEDGMFIPAEKLTSYLYKY